jgi:hypothetical protein
MIKRGTNYCDNCIFYLEVAGGPDHGDYRCTNKESKLYDRRIHELELEEIPLAESCIHKIKREDKI